MSQWVLVIYFVAMGNSGVAVTSINGFTQEKCEAAATKLTWSKPQTPGGPHRSFAMCVQRTSN